MKALWLEISLFYKSYAFHMLWHSSCTLPWSRTIIDVNSEVKCESEVCVCECMYSQAMHQGSHRPQASHWSTPAPPPHVPSQPLWLIPSQGPGDGRPGPGSQSLGPPKGWPGGAVWGGGGKPISRAPNPGRGAYFWESLHSRVEKAHIHYRRKLRPRLLWLLYRGVGGERWGRVYLSLFIQRVKRLRDIGV